MKTKYLFKAKTKEKQTPTENHHSIETFIGFVEKGISDAKSEPRKRPAKSLIKEENWKHQNHQKQEKILSPMQIKKEQLLSCIL